MRCAFVRHKTADVQARATVQKQVKTQTHTNTIQPA